MEYDIVIIGGGQSGLSFACSMMETSIKILLVEKRSFESLCEPKSDGREIALTHLSVDILKKIGVWQFIPKGVISPLKEARIFDGNELSSLNFSCEHTAYDALGYLVANSELCTALFKRVQTASNIEIVTDVMVEDVIRRECYSSITLSTGEQVNTKLVVAADSRFSAIRRKMGIPAVMKDFSKVMVVSQMKLEKPHHHIALECFHYGRTVALLPMAGNHASVVMTVTADKAAELVKQDEEKFNRQITQLFKGEFGRMELEGEHYTYPLVGVYSQSLVSPRFALIGDAAVGMHPVTAHGSNLGLRGQAILADSLKEALSSGTDIGEISVLKRYENKQIHITRLLYFGTNSIVALFTNDTPIARNIRKVVLKIASHFPPIKHIITRHLTNTNLINRVLPF